jgi:Predicted membrane protein (DUF2306)
MGERAKSGVITALAFIVVGYAAALLVRPDLRPPFLPARAEDASLAASAYIAATAVVLAFGPFQLSTRLRSRRLVWHRWMGRAYITSVLVGGASGIALATMASGGVPAEVGFGLLGVLWMLTAILAYQRIRVYDIADHRRWTIRSYSLALAAVTLRIYLPLAVGVMRIPFDQAYPAIAWLCWVPNLIIAEWVFLRRSPVSAAAPEPSDIFAA